jgi:hypothetical protein
MQISEQLKNEIRDFAVAMKQYGVNWPLTYMPPNPYILTRDARAAFEKILTGAQLTDDDWLEAALSLSPEIFPSELLGSFPEIRQFSGFMPVQSPEYQIRKKLAEALLADAQSGYRLSNALGERWDNDAIRAYNALLSANSDAQGSGPSASDFERLIWFLARNRSFVGDNAPPGLYAAIDQYFAQKAPGTLSPPSPTPGPYAISDAEKAQVRRTLDALNRSGALRDIVATDYWKSQSPTLVAALNRYMTGQNLSDLDWFSLRVALPESGGALSATQQPVVPGPIPNPFVPLNLPERLQPTQQTPDYNTKAGQMLASSLAPTSGIADTTQGGLSNEEKDIIGQTLLRLRDSGRLSGGGITTPHLQYPPTMAQAMRKFFAGEKLSDADWLSLVPFLRYAQMTGIGGSAQEFANDPAEFLTPEFVPKYIELARNYAARIARKAGGTGALLGRVRMDYGTDVADAYRSLFSGSIDDFDTFAKVLGTLKELGRKYEYMEVADHSTFWNPDKVFLNVLLAEPAALRKPFPGERRPPFGWHLNRYREIFDVYFNRQTNPPGTTPPAPLPPTPDPLNRPLSYMTPEYVPLYIEMARNSVDTIAREAGGANALLTRVARDYGTDVADAYRNLMAGRISDFDTLAKVFGTLKEVGQSYGVSFPTDKSLAWNPRKIFASVLLDAPIYVGQPVTGEGRPSTFWDLNRIRGVFDAYFKGQTSTSGTAPRTNLPPLPTQQPSQQQQAQQPTALPPLVSPAEVQAAQDRFAALQAGAQLNEQGLRDYIAALDQYAGASETALRQRLRQIEQTKAEAADYAIRQAKLANAAGSLPASAGGASLARYYAATFPALQAANDLALQIENQLNQIKLTTAQQRAEALRRLGELQSTLGEAKSNLTLLTQQAQPANQQGTTQFLGTPPTGSNTNSFTALYAPPSQQKSSLDLTMGTGTNDSAQSPWRKNPEPWDITATSRSRVTTAPQQTQRQTANLDWSNWFGRGFWGRFQNRASKNVWAPLPGTPLYDWWMNQEKAGKRVIWG